MLGRKGIIKRLLLADSKAEKELEQWKGQKSIYYQPQAEIGRMPVF